ncbi:MAG: hypothetical protein QOF94_1303 [Acidobacteriaceae bacterium]
MKKIGFLTLLMSATFLLILASPVAATGPKVTNALLPVVAAAAPPAAMPERHPHIEEALESMRPPSTIWNRRNTILGDIGRKRSRIWIAPFAKRKSACQ